MSSVVSALSPKQAPQQVRAAWHAHLREPALIAGLIALIAWAYWPTVRELAGAGERSDTHFAFVGPAFAWLVWNRLDAVKGLPLRPWWPGLMALALLPLAWTLGELVFVRIVTDAAVVAMIPAAVLALFGPAWVRALGFPLGFLVFAVPFWAPLVPALVSATASALAVALPLSGIPMHREGAFFSIPSGQWAVADACSGVEYLGACVILGALMAETFFTAWKKRAAFMAAALAVGIAGNWLRAYLVVVIAHLTDNRLLREDHGWFGWLLYAFMLAALGWVGWRHQDKAVAPLWRPQAVQGKPRRWALPAALGMLIALAVWPAVLTGLMQREAAASPPRIADIPPANGWRPVAADPARWAPLLHHPAAQRTQSFVKDGRRVEVHIGLFERQSWDSKLVDARHKLADSDTTPWAAVSSGRENIQFHGEALRVNTVTLIGNGSRELVWQWYIVGERATGSGMAAKLGQLRAILGGKGDAAAWIALSGDAQKPEALGLFMRDMGVPLHRPIAGLGTAH